MPGLGALTNEAAYELVSYLLTNLYDNVPYWVPNKRDHKRHIMHRLRRRIRRLCGLSFDVHILQRMWSDMKRREPEFVVQVELDLRRRGNAQEDVQQEAVAEEGPQIQPPQEEEREEEAEEPILVEEQLVEEDFWVDEGSPEIIPPTEEPQPGPAHQEPEEESAPRHSQEATLLSGVSQRLEAIERRLDTLETRMALLEEPAQADA